MSYDFTPLRPSPLPAMYADLFLYGERRKTKIMGGSGAIVDVLADGGRGS
jgi:hypothetical protein